MAINIQGNGEFLCDVSKALGKICPGVTVDSQGFVQVTDVVCSDYCRHRAGCNLLMDLIEVGGKVVVVQNEWSSWYCSKDHKIGWKPGSNGKECCKPCGTPGWVHHPGEPILAHELIHAWHQLLKGVVTPNECCTVCCENQVRKEMGVHARCRYYGHQCDPNPGDCVDCDHEAANQECPLLDTVSKRKDCYCFFVRWVQWLRKAVPLPFRLFMRQPRRPVRDPDPEALEKGLERSGFGEVLRAWRKGPVPESHVDEMTLAVRSLLALRAERSSTELERLFRECRDGALLELVMLHGGYHVFLFAGPPAGPAFASNVRLRDSGGGDALGPEGDLVLSPISGSEWDRIGKALHGPETGAESAGVGGRFGIMDGAAQFLRVRREGRIQGTATRGLSFSGGPDGLGEIPSDPSDARRWTAIRTVMDLGLHQLTRMDRPTVLRSSRKPQREED